MSGPTMEHLGYDAADFFRYMLLQDLFLLFCLYAVTWPLGSWKLFGPLRESV